ncbi:hypothetical protein OMW55_11720 [Sphingomonas sp. BN140010]|uniref:Uncharacterized protein n=1 Tax=Sphingomonas arvum TaxID=2992113 RepID=A0ABT3JHB8_9SPHN|nr:hypothetical protein [Sphingomonas sp. BN140010]MCW3798473.1 hypothetical protein [Sphingomonas sp. BN140010]
MSDGPPKLRLATNKTEAELAKERALGELRWPTREMAANLFRVTRGAGGPHELPRQIIDLSSAILDAAKHSNAWDIWSVMEEVLGEALTDPNQSDIESSFHTIVRGSLQTAASNLLKQNNAQEAAGTCEILEGIDERERAAERFREERRKEFAEEQARIAVERAASRAEKRAAAKTAHDAKR